MKKHERLILTRYTKKHAPHSESHLVLTFERQSPAEGKKPQHEDSKPKRFPADEAARGHALSFLCSRFQWNKSQASQRAKTEKKTAASGILGIVSVVESRSK
jgi:hypothetical protein